MILILVPVRRTPLSIESRSWPKIAHPGIAGGHRSRCKSTCERTLSSVNPSRGDFLDSSDFRPEMRIGVAAIFPNGITSHMSRFKGAKSQERELPFSFSTFNVSKFHQLWIKVKGKLIFDLKVYSHETFLCIHGNVTTTSQPNCANPVQVLHQKNDNSSLLYNTKHTGRTQPFKDTLWFPKMFLFSFLYSPSGSKELYISIEVEEGIQCLSLASITVGLGVGWPTITQLPAQALQST